MKIFKLLLLVTLTSTLFYSCTSKKTEDKSGFTTIMGTFDLPGKTEITLYKIEHGKKFNIATSTINENKEFGFAFNSIKEGFYILGDKFEEVPLYVKKNQVFKVKYDVNGYELLQSPDKENDILYQFNKLTDTLETFKFYRKPITTYEQFFPFYEKFLPEIKKQHDAVTTSNEKFNTLMNTYIDVKAEYEALNFIQTPRSKHPANEDLPPFYFDFIKNDSLVNSDVILEVPNGIRTVFSHQAFKHKQMGDKAGKYITDMFNGIDNNLIKGHYSLEFIKKFKYYNQNYLDFIEPLRKDIALSDYVTAEVDKYEQTIKSMDPGAQGYPFTYKDINDKDVSFSDFKGKVVYIDIWATWCAPCKVQIPYLQKLEKELHGKDIQFVSLSLDKPKVHAKWKKFVEDEQLSGIQLISDNAFDTQIAKDYKITGIPRFLLFDKEGKIVDADAKRPSDPALKKQLLELLK